MKALLAMSILFLVGGIGNSMNWVEDPSYSNALAAYTASVILASIYVYFRLQRKVESKLLVWLDENSYEIRNGYARYQNMRITPATQYTQYEMVISFVVLHSRLLTSPRLNEVRPVILSNIGYRSTGVLLSAMTLILGWWSIPWGPIHTIRAVLQNIRGGHKGEVGELLLEETPIREDRND